MLDMQKEIHNFRESQKTNIALEMFILWEYKLSKTIPTKRELFKILKNDGVFIKTDSSFLSLRDIKQKDFFDTLSLYKNNNKKLYLFCCKMVRF